MSDAQLLLRSLFKVSCALKDQAEDQGMELTELRDSCELLRLRHEYDQAELEQLQAEVAARATPMPSAPASAAGAATLVCQFCLRLSAPGTRTSPHMLCVGVRKSADCVNS